MATSCEISWLRPDQYVDTIHCSSDGYLLNSMGGGVGGFLFKHYSTAEKVAALFSYDTWLTEFLGDPSEIEWDEWPEDNMRDVLVAKFIQLKKDIMDQYVEMSKTNNWLIDDIKLGLFFYAHNKWFYVHNAEDLENIITTGVGKCEITLKSLAADAEVSVERVKALLEEI